MALLSQATFYLLYGTDDLTLTETLSSLRAEIKRDPNAALNLDEMEGQGLRVGSVVNAVTSLPFLSAHRFVIVQGLIAHLTRKNSSEADKRDLETLITTLPTLPAHARLILVERGNLRADSKLVKFATSASTAHCWASQPPDDMTGWITKRVKAQYQAEIEPGAAAALASVIGTDVRSADMELVKLVSYVDGQRAIRESDVMLLTPYRPEANVFHLVEAAAGGQIKQALTLLNLALEQDPSDPGFGILALLINQFRRLLLLKDHLEHGGNLDSAASALGLKANQQWLVQKQYAPQARKFSYNDLERHYRALHHYDKDIKTGRIVPRLALDLFITGLAQKA